MSTTVQIMFPVGRYVSGNLFELVTKDDKGQPLAEAKHHWNIGVAIPKTPGRDWRQEQWGQLIVNAVQADWPNREYDHPSFSWKVKDGDSTVRNKPNSKAPSEHEGWPGHWVVFFRRGKQIGEVPLVNANGTENFALRAQKQVKKGDYIQIFGSCKGTNSNPGNPGCYVNHDVVAFAGKGQEIISANRPDPTKLGFGGALPAGATAAPVTAVVPAVTPAGGIQGQQHAAFQGQQSAPAVTAVQPNPAFLTPGVPSAAPAAPAVPSVPPTAPVRQMTAKAGNVTYEQLIANNWTDELLRHHGYML